MAGGEEAASPAAGNIQWVREEESRDREKKREGGREERREGGMEARLAASPAEHRPAHPFRAACGAAAPGLSWAALPAGCAGLGCPGRGAERRRQPPPLRPLLFRSVPPPPPPRCPSLRCQPGPAPGSRPRRFPTGASWAGPGAEPAGQPLRGARSLRAAARTGRAGAGTGAGWDAPDGALFCCCCFYSLPLCAPQPHVCASRCHVSPRMNNRGVRHEAVGWAGSGGLKVITRVAIEKPLPLFFFLPPYSSWAARHNGFGKDQWNCTLLQVHLRVLLFTVPGGWRVESRKGVWKSKILLPAQPLIQLFKWFYFSAVAPSICDLGQQLLAQKEHYEECPFALC